ncbi:MAG: hypothetical protein J6M63_04090 [Pseudobutyrivibrio sp.]|uniref:capsular polysaccharide export protein, LipB/KpsS family n=1 Tax=Pseudobutyrivibrio sp. TaxID=2014367 RepID=UPI001B003CEC|nr:hypothetical protein [Pseudobutyrivibrio sp.]MBO5618011.1 hypothetical protein [Pseudobutyrivibrio sp.]MBO6283095.1 hypothetical protein [Pseudobutyrivibrio sp.]MBP3262363.1 hypothetical protein [Pseudobutyrivibrio sp.]
MYTICFMARRPFEDFSPAVYKKLKAAHDDVKAVFITCDKQESAYIWAKFNEEEKKDIVVCEISEFMNKHWDEFTVEKLAEMEAKYDANPIWKYIYTDRYLIYRDYDYCVHTAAGLFAFWEYVFNTYHVDFFYDEVIATLLTYAAYLVGKKTNTGYYSLMFMRACGMDLTHHYILNDPFEKMYDMPEDYASIPVTEEQRAAAEAYLTKFEEQHSKPAFMKFSGKKPKWKPIFFVLPFFYLKQRFFNPLTRDKGSYIYYKCYEHTMDQLVFYLRYSKGKKYFKKADYSKKFVYFPLHMQPEATTIVCAQKYEKQLYFIDSLVKSLPADTMLYVKEHYSFLGIRDNSFYEQLQVYPNVVLIDPWEDSIKLIEKSECVATLTGTAGQEAMMLRHPVFMSGDIIYKGAPGVMYLEEVFGNYEKMMSEYKRPTRDEVIQYMAVYMSHARLGNTYVLSEERLSDENLANVAESMYSYFKEMKHE